MTPPPPHQATQTAEPGPQSDEPLWEEHGWALQGRHIAAIVLLVLLLHAISAVVG